MHKHPAFAATVLTGGVSSPVQMLRIVRDQMMLNLNTGRRHRQYFELSFEEAVNKSDSKVYWTAAETVVGPPHKSQVAAHF